VFAESITLYVATLLLWYGGVGIPLY